ncbi:recombination protein RecR [Flavobacteriaceae bacterium UJ101]|nr:recombination protein RecR [Flavobacteriaceae bacterium UJ101]
MNYPSKILENAVYEISQLPGIGKRSALRLVLHMLRHEKEDTKRLAFALNQLVEEIKYCKRCHNISDIELCEICANPVRDQYTLCIVEDVRDVMAIENTGQYKGLYHVLGGIISPMDGIGPGQLNIQSLIDRIEKESINEIIFALSSTMEGDTTMFYIYKVLKEVNVKISTIARGISVGDEIEYADEVTLGRSLLNRISYEQVLKG